ncbi:MAG: 2TM domain-containing protein [Chitinophagaceae bacterium]|nr:2TM domain-containing protein [Chitinophagaceae bacterium]
MEQYTTPPPDKDPALWAIARKRASFKSNLITYLIVNAFIWALWFLTADRNNYKGWPWPIWPTLGWGVGIVFHYFSAFVYPESNATEREYEKLKRKQQ